MIVNRLHAPGDGDIVLPQRLLTVIGTTSWITDDPDDLAVPEDHVQAMIREGSALVPAVAGAPIRAAWSAARPLAGDGRSADARATSGRELARTFNVFDHASGARPVEGFVTIAGGKATTLRAMAEATAEVVCRKVGVDRPCRTRDVELLPHSAWYSS